MSETQTAWYSPYQSDWDKVQQVDFTWIKKKLMDKEEGEGWTDEFTTAVLEEYRKYLLLTKVNPDTAIVPSKPVDTAWHYHILDTQAYVVDCDKVFGKFLHHFPYWGMRGDDDAKDLQESFARTLEIYERTVGPVPAEFWKAAGRCPNCGVGCFAPGTAVLMADGSARAIEKLKIGDLTAGGRVTAVMQYEPSSPLYEYKGVLVSGSHAVFEDNKWKRVHEASKAILSTLQVPAFHCIRTVDHKVFVGDTLFADELEVEGPALQATFRICLAELNETARKATKAA